ncbi:MAG: PAS domain S-box protein, partial [Rhodospirillales bacterium]|nr:PAS domain S-box protein [Rhodospirillales bacterium]
MQIWLLSAVAAGVGGFVLGQIWSRRGCRRCERSTEAELAHAQARRLQHQYVDAVESISEGFVLFDSTDHLVLCNSKYRDSLAPIASRLVPGITFDEIARLSAEHGLIKAALGRPEAWLQERLAEHRAPSGPVEMEMFDGRVLLSREYRTHDGGIVAIRTDITERKRAERALTQSEQHLRGVMATMVDGLIAIDSGGIVLSFNPAAERIFGYAAAEVIGRNVNVLMPEPFRSEHGGHLHRYIEDGGPRVIGMGRQVSARRKDGSIFPVDLAVGELRRDGEITFIGILRDITDRVRVERELKDAKDQLAAAIESITEGFALWDPEDRLVLCNSVYRDFFPPGVGAVRPGGRFEDMLRALVSHCQIPEAEGRRETWI